MPGLQTIPCEDALAAYNRLRRGMFFPKADLPGRDEELRDRQQRRGAVFQAQLPQVARLAAAALGATPMRVERLGEQGTFHGIFAVALDDGSAWIVRTSAGEGTAPDYGLLLDRWAQQQLQAHGLPALAVPMADCSRRQAPFDFEVLQQAPGWPLQRLDVRDARLTPLLIAWGSLLARVHRIGARGYGLLQVCAPEDGNAGAVAGGAASWADYLGLHLESHVGRCVDAGAVSRDEAAQIGRLFAECSVAPAAPRLLHGDPGHHNVFTDGQDITALIDWEDAVAGDPVYDVALWGTFNPEENLASFLTGYRRECPLQADFAVRYWLYFLRVALAKTVHRQRFGYPDVPGRPPAALRIQLGLRRLREALHGELRY